MAQDKPQICGAVDELDYGIWFECELLPGHAGDHQTLHTWQNEPYGPKPAPTAPRSKFVPDAWAKTIEEAWLRTLLARPVEPCGLVVNRDLEG